MIHPHTEVRFIDDVIGYGLVAKEFIPKGTITWVLDAFDRKFTTTERQALDTFHQELLATYSYRDNNGHYVLCWDNARFVNHSFRSNCLSTAYDFEFAVRDIAPGEQLTDDYGYLNVDTPFQGRDEGTERKTVYPDDLLNYHEQWDDQLRNTFPLITTVHQPLQRLFSEARWNALCEIGNGTKEMASILNCYFEDRTHRFVAERS